MTFPSPKLAVSARDAGIMSEIDQCPDNQRQPTSIIINFQTKVMSHDALHTRKNISQAIMIWIWVPPDYFLNALNTVSIFQVLLKSPGVLRK